MLGSDFGYKFGHNKEMMGNKEEELTALLK
jgi:hypothetical protein